MPDLECTCGEVAPKDLRPGPWHLKTCPRCLDEDPGQARRAVFEAAHRAIDDAAGVHRADEAFVLYDEDNNPAPASHSQFAFWEQAYIAVLHHEGARGAAFQAGLALQRWLKVRKNLP